LCGITIGRIIAMTTFALILPLTEAQQRPEGMVDEPRMEVYEVLPAQNAVLEFKGWVNTKDVVVAQIEVFDNNSGRRVHRADAFPSSKPIIVDGQERFLWSSETGDIRRQLFRPNVPEPPGQPQPFWPEGGVARVRVTARLRQPFNFGHDETNRFTLAVRDIDGVPGRVNTESALNLLLLVDNDPSPAALPHDFTPNLPEPKVKRR
jgi:hypothetical protein